METSPDLDLGLPITALEPGAYEAAIPELGALLVDAVEGGASVNFMAGVTPAEAAGWWTELYRSLGWQVLGTMPNHAYRSNGILAPTTYFWKDLREAGQPGDGDGG